MFTREMKKTIKDYLKFPVVAIIGPRQSGKTTLVKTVFPKHTFVSFENPLTREFAIKEPERFLQSNENEHGIIIDEFQYVPQILSYIQLDVDAKKRKGYFILTGSQNFLMNQAITQSLAGRVGILTLLPLSLKELTKNKLLPARVEEVIYNGSYPRFYDEHFKPERLFPSYIQTYIERDVRQLVNVGDLGAFQKFIQLCAARVGNQLNLADLGAVCGISATTAQRWISVLQASFIIFLLEPHFENFNKRLTKLPKLYFYDTGLACNLLRITSPEDLLIDKYFGALFECFIISDIMKQYFNQGLRPPVYFWRDTNGRLEVDCIIDEGKRLFPIEIKSSDSIATDFFNGLRQWTELAYGSKDKADVSHSFLIYAGKQQQLRAGGTVIPWGKCSNLVEQIRASIKGKKAVKKKK